MNRTLFGLAGALIGALTFLPDSVSAANLPTYSLRSLPAAVEYVTAIDDQRNILGSSTINGRSTTVVIRPDGTHWLPAEGLVSNPPDVEISVQSMNRHGQMLLMYPFAVGPLPDFTDLNREFNRSTPRFDEGSNVVIRMVVRDEKGAQALPDFPFRLDYCMLVLGTINNAGNVAVNYMFWNGQFNEFGQADIVQRSMFCRPRQGWQHFPSPAGLPQSQLHYFRDDGSAIGVAFSVDFVTGTDGSRHQIVTDAPCLFRQGKPAIVLTPLRGKVHSLNPRGDAVMGIPGELGAFVIPPRGDLVLVRRGEGPRALGRLQRDDGVNPVQRVGDCIQWHLSDDGTLTYKVATEITPVGPGDPRGSIYVKCDVYVTTPGQPDVVIHNQDANAVIGRFVPGDGLWVGYGPPFNAVTFQGEFHPYAELVPGNADWLNFLALAGERVPIEQINWRPGDFNRNYFNELPTPLWASLSPPKGGPRMKFLLEPSGAVVRHLEVTQVVQDWNQSIPLVAGKRTFVRAHVEALQPGAVGKPARGKIRGFINGMELSGSPIETINRRGRGTVARDTTATREQPGMALDFVLPLSWCTNTLKLVVESAEGHFGNHAESFTFTVVPPLRIEFFPLTILNDDGAPIPTSDAEVILLQDRLLGMMPVAHLRSGHFRHLDIKAEQLSSSSDLGRVNSRLRETLALDADGRGLAATMSGRERARQLGYYIAVTDLVGNLGGEADGLGAGLPPRVDPGTVATITGQAESPYRAAHELAHLLGQYHATTSERKLTRDGESFKLGYCDEFAPLLVPDVVPDFPHFGRVPGQAHNVPLLGPLNGPERILGVREGPTGRPEFLSTLRHFEVMGYCDQPNRWISGYTYTNCLQAISEFFGAPPPVPAGAPMSAFTSAGGAPASDLVLVRGSVNLDSGVVQLEPCLPFGAGPAPAPAGSGGLLLRFVNTSGLVLRDWPFDVGMPVEQERVKHFSLIVARPPDLAQLQVLRAGELVASLAASAHAPTVQLLTPNGGPVPAGNTIHVVWQAADLDGDPLRFALRYSADDGATWRTLMPDTDGTSLEIAASSLNGSTMARFQVVATDGLKFAADVSDAAVQVAEPPPSVVVLTPKPGHRFHLSETLMLRASGHSASAGFDSFQEVTWTSDRAGVLGAGLQRQVPVSSLALGLHQITVTVRDATGQPATNTVAIQVDEFAAAEMLAPELDGETGTLNLPVMIEPGALATLEGSTNLLDWTVITNQMAVGDRVDFERPLEFGHRFYRISASGAAPVITEGPLDIALTGQTAVTLDVFVEGTPPVSYHWLHNGLPVASSSPLSSLVLVNPGSSDLGTYVLVASNRFGRAQSQTFNVTATGEVPTFTLQPENVCFFRFLETVRFRVGVAGTPTPTFQWFFKGAPLPGENDSELIVDPDPSEMGDYHVVVANALGTATSNVGRFLICPPEINRQPDDACIKVGISDGLFVGVESFHPPVYQWHFNNSPLLSGTNFALAFQPFQATNAGAYFVTVSGLGITQTSQVAQVTICP